MEREDQPRKTGVRLHDCQDQKISDGQKLTFTGLKAGMTVAGDVFPREDDTCRVSVTSYAGGGGGADTENPASGAISTLETEATGIGGREGAFERERSTAQTEDGARTAAIRSAYLISR